MSVFHELIDARDRLTTLVENLLQALERGQIPMQPEGEHIDCKEEPGRRGPGGILLPGETRSNAAAQYLANKVCCMANTPGGGVLVLGIEDETWQVLGTELDHEWLRLRIYQLTHVAPATESRIVQGQRVVVLSVAEAPEPVEDTDSKIRWRVADSCQPVDRAEWWLSRQRTSGADSMAAITVRKAAEVTAASMQAARRYLGAGGDAETAAVESTDEVLRRVGVLTNEGFLTQAGVILFCAASRPLITLSRLDVAGGNVMNSWEPESGSSLLEQIQQVETRLDAWNPVRPTVRGFAEEPIRALPVRAVREAVLNGLTHRDWMQHEPTTVRWIDADSRLEVESPGGFTGGITQHNVLTRRHARYPALSDLFRALRLVDKQGVGVDRMYREMIVLGHRPPQISEQSGPHVRTVLEGGEPAVPVMTLVEAIKPKVRQRDVRIAVLLFSLLHYPFLTQAGVARVLQDDEAEAASALQAAEQTTVNSKSLIAGYKDVWMLGSGALEIVEREIRQRGPSSRRGLLRYRRPVTEVAREIVKAWLAEHERITSGDYAALTGVAQPNATRILTGLVDDLLVRGTGNGYAHFVLREQVPSSTTRRGRHLSDIFEHG